MTNGLSRLNTFTLSSNKKIDTPSFFYGGLKGLESTINPYTPIDKVLISAYHVLCNANNEVKPIDVNWKTNDFTDHVDGAFIFFDSGGYTFTHKHITITPQTLLDLYDVFKPDLAAILDHPFDYKISLHANLKQRWSTTLKNTEYMFANKPDDLNLLTIVHAWNKSQVKSNIADLRKMYQRIGVDEYEAFKYLGIGAITETFTFKDFSSWNVADILIYLRTEFPDSFIHMFGVNSFLKLLTCYYLGADSSDSASWKLAACYGNIYLPGSMIAHPSSTKQRPLTDFERKLLSKCNCPVCRDRTVDESIERLQMGLEFDGQATFKSRALHNYWINESLMKSIEKLIKDEMLGEFIQKRVGSDTKNMFHYANKILNKKNISDYY